ncbi:sigma-54 interaction domain-containing protein [Polymorphobacter sp.]|uniref:sigma-54 interaction domain-containing protein n=1 Tax=Polymorphobacter sp. TaxID=1909290 RepID=UPI003F6FA2F1
MPQLAQLIGTSPAMTAIRNTVEKVADSAASVLITGPSGSGKDVVAQLLHQRSRRAAQPFIALNCAAVAPDLLESEMFGHEAGAFTGAIKARAGRFEAANGGTLFLDEVGDMPAAMQAKLLRALETRVVERVGGMLPIHVDVRLVAATSVDLHAAIDRGLFRSDLLYRLDVIRIEMPPLAERPEDIPALIEHFDIALGGPPVRFSPAALAVLMAEPWPGNVRELKNFIERAKAHHPDEIINSQALPTLMRARHRSAGGVPEPGVDLSSAAPLHPDTMPMPLMDSPIDLRQLLADLEQAYIRAALAASGGTISRCARLLGLQRTTLIEKMRRMQIDIGRA